MATHLWRNRIIGYGEVAPDQLLAHPNNARLHPLAQQEALLAVLEQVGIVQDVICTEDGTVVDGHLRVVLALRQNQPTIPVKYTDLTPAEVALVLATFDKIASYAGYDGGNLRELLGMVDIDDPRLAATFADLNKLAKKSLVLPSADDPLWSTALDGNTAENGAESGTEASAMSGRGNVSLDERPVAQERFALPIVLTKEQRERWQVVKADLQQRSDTEAFMLLVARYEGES